MARAYKPGGLAWINDGDKTVEYETFTCKHCNHVVVIPHKCRPEDVGGLCYSCMGLICSACADIPNCNHIERWLEREEARGRFRRELSNGV